MTNITFSKGKLNQQIEETLRLGFEQHSMDQAAPSYHKEALNWVITDESGTCIAVLTASLLWDWLYIDELWVAEVCRGSGYGKLLLKKAEEYARGEDNSGVWLWTQSWQAPQFYEQNGYVEFTRFENFPKGHCRIGLRKAFID